MNFVRAALMLGCLLFPWTGFAQSKPVVPPPPPPPPGGVLEALSLIPEAAAKRLARVEAREGSPLPQRWYVLVWEPESPTGLREFAISAGRIAAARGLSQFADKLTEADAFGAAWVRADADYCIQIASAFAAANGQKIGSVQFTLARPIVPAATPDSPPQPTNAEANWPQWQITPLDAKGDQLGLLVISAARGTVLSHSGFEKEPSPALLPMPPTPPPASVTNPKPPKAATPKPQTKKKGRT